MKAALMVGGIGWLIFGHDLAKSESVESYIVGMGCALIGYCLLKHALKL